jgi:hypothetical protein
MCYWIFPESGQPISRSTVQAITHDDLATTQASEMVRKFDERIKEKLNHGSNDLFVADAVPIGRACRS